MKLLQISKNVLDLDLNLMPVKFDYKDYIFATLLPPTPQLRSHYLGRETDFKRNIRTIQESVINTVA